MTLGTLQLQQRPTRPISNETAKTMRLSTIITLSFALSLPLVGCGDDDTEGTGGGTSTTTTTTSTTSSGGGQGGSSTSTGSTTSTGGSGGAGAGGMEPFLCETAREQALGPVAMTSTGAVTILSDNAGDREVYVDASAGGFQGASMNPWVYLDLASATRVDIDDPTSFSDGSWDIAIKRVGWRSNSLHSGPGSAGVAWLDGATFEDVTLQDAQSATLGQEDWFDAMCEYETDMTGALVTSFGTWYDYNGQTMQVTPKAGVYVILGADGTSYFKLQLIDYYANPDGSTGGQTSGRYLLRVQAL